MLQVVSQRHSAPKGRKVIAPGEASGMSAKACKATAEASETRGNSAQRTRGRRAFLHRKNRDGPENRVVKPVLACSAAPGFRISPCQKSRRGETGFIPHSLVLREVQSEDRAKRTHSREMREILTLSRDPDRH
jgi:hypothetical protein